MYLDRKISNYRLARHRQRERFEEFTNWFPFPALISFVLAMILSVELMPMLNPRLGNPADLMNYGHEVEKEGSLWLAIKAIKGEIVVVTSDQKVFRWPAKLQDEKPLERFVKYLKTKVNHEIRTAALARETSAQRTLVVIAADQRLKYLHIRPLLNALAEARITDYAFETTLLDTAKASEEKSATHHNDHM